MWTDSARAKYVRPAERYATDLTDAEFALIEPWLPPTCGLGRPRTTDLRAVLDAIFYLLRTGCPSGAADVAPAPSGTDDRLCRSWRLLPKVFPPRSTVYGYFRRWWRDGTLLGLYYALLVLARQAAGREPQPTAGIVDSQSVKTSESGGPRGVDAGKRIPTGPAARAGSAARTGSTALPSMAASGTCWSTRWACCCAASSIPPASRTATGWPCC